LTAHPTGLLDTSTVILLPRLHDPTALPDAPLISAITLAELSVGPLVAATETERAARLAHLQQAEADFEPLPFDADAARAFGQVAASLRRAGRKTSARAYDAMIAAVAIANDLPLYTCNPDDFSGIAGLEVVSVAHPDMLPSTG
jgi:predicted nucleic acid-binding protein